ncbi:hypothetical protein BJ138DRAFT_1107014 [Hygrophoropsis aurantiaca]|uniref:Uncharacterized protein n=1 Tax=Hygrophoropsis aurantiaca TaxID=72124 RepID=A0ACB7ZTE3_9AGAM|nr:hypothetical protein BJ138DRAFT_1107014 [Hygrophoropsis aurantiaca]
MWEGIRDMWKGIQDVWKGTWDVWNGTWDVWKGNPRHQDMWNAIQCLVRIKFSPRSPWVSSWLVTSTIKPIHNMCNGIRDMCNGIRDMCNGIWCLAIESGVLQLLGSS